MKVIISPRAEKELRKIPKLDQIVIIKKIRSLKDNVSQGEKLSGYRNLFRLRIGNYRIVYRFLPTQLYIILIRHRRDVYRMLKDLF